MAHESAPAGDGNVHRPPPPGQPVRGAVREACRRLYAAEENFVASFRMSLVELVPELRGTTIDDGGAIAESLARAVLWAGLTTDPPDVVEEIFRKVGAEYRRQGFPLTGYRGASHALLRAARDTQSGDWTSELSSAWVAYYSWLAAHLTEGARLAGPAAPPPPPRTGPISLGGIRTSSAYTTSPPASPFPPAVPPGAGPRARARQAELSIPHGDTPAAAGTSETDQAGTAGPGSLDEVLEALRRRYFPGNEHALTAIVTRVALRTGADLHAPRSDQRTNPAVITNVIAVLRVMGYVLPAEWGGRSDAGSSGATPERPRGRWWNRRRGGRAVREWGGSLPETSR